MRVYALIPVEETFHVDGVADLQVLNSLIDLSVFAAEIGLNGESIGLIVNGNVEVQVIAFFTGTVPLVKESYIVAGGILGSFYLHAGERSQLVLLQVLYRLFLLVHLWAQVFGLTIRKANNGSKSKENSACKSRSY